CVPIAPFPPAPPLLQPAAVIDGLGYLSYRRVFEDVSVCSARIVRKSWLSPLSFAAQASTSSAKHGQSSPLVFLIPPDYLNAWLALHDASDGQQRLHRLRVVPAMVGDLDMRCPDGAAAQRGVESKPLPVDPDLRPHVIRKRRPLTKVGVHQAE